MNSPSVSARPRVLAIHRYYWPDAPPYASILRSIVERLHQNGFQTEVFASQPSYKLEAKIAKRPRWEHVDGTITRRISLPLESGKIIKAINMVLFTLVSFLHALKRQREVIMCSTSPPVILAAAVSIAAKARGAKFVYHCMDLHPEIGALSGDFKNPIVYRGLRRIDMATCRRASAVIVLSEDMKNSLLDRDPTIVDRIIVLNNFDLPDYEEQSEARDEIPHRSERLRLVFTGNIGRFQGLETIVDAFVALRNEIDAELIFMGEGGAKSALMSRAGVLGPNSRVQIQFLPHGTPTHARELMRSADLGLVALVPSVIKFAFPSKTMTYLSESLPLFVMAEPESELASTIANEELGFTSPPLDTDAAIETLKIAVANQGGLDKMQMNARHYSGQQFDREKALTRWQGLFTDLTKKQVRKS